MTEDSEPRVIVTARRKEGWRPWFGDRHAFERLCRARPPLYIEL